MNDNLKIIKKNDIELISIKKIWLKMEKRIFEGNWIF